MRGGRHEPSSCYPGPTQLLPHLRDITIGNGLPRPRLGVVYFYLLVCFVEIVLISCVLLYLVFTYSTRVLVGMRLVVSLKIVFSCKRFLTAWNLTVEGFLFLMRFDMTFEISSKMERL